MLAFFKRIRVGVQHLALQNQLLGQHLLREILAEGRYADPQRLERAGFSAYSQNDEDGILAEIFRRIGTTHRTFLEIGVQGGLENNTLLLLFQGWRGAWIEGSGAYVGEIEQRFAPWLAEGRLRVRRAMVTAENINGLVEGLLPPEVPPEGLDLLSIDIDGNDYHVFAALTAARPRVVVIEYNGRLPPPTVAVVPYAPSRIWNGTDYYGASLEAMTRLAEAKGYRLVATNLLGVNAFYVRADLAGEHFASPATAAHLYNPMGYHLQGAFRRGHRKGFGPWLLEDQL
jgi:hypothetical protein